MTRYTLIEGEPREVRYVDFQGSRIINPKDEFLDENSLGYVKNDAMPTAPTYDPETQKLKYGWTIQDNEIVRTVEVIDRPLRERLSDVLREISRLDADYNAFTEQPLQYTDNHYYKPSWVSMYYSITLQVGTFPRNIANCDTLTPTQMTLDQLKDLCIFLSNAVDAKLAAYQEAMGPLMIKKAQIEALIEAERQQRLQEEPVTE